MSANADDAMAWVTAGKLLPDPRCTWNFRAGEHDDGNGSAAAITAKRLAATRCSIKGCLAEVHDGAQPLQGRTGDKLRPQVQGLVNSGCGRGELP
jgi:hypothetical protein